MNTLNAPVPVPHANLQLEYVRQEVYGELNAGWWWWELSVDNKGWERVSVNTPQWYPDRKYRYVMSEKHPKYVASKPKLKLIDMAKLPKGSVVTLGGGETLTVWGTNNQSLILIRDNGSMSLSLGFITRSLRIAEQKDFTYWGGGGCPVPNGVKVEVILRNNERFLGLGFSDIYWVFDDADHDVIAYRIVGVADGWTDNPKAAE